MSAPVFISYRRDDSFAEAGWLKDLLEKSLDNGLVFQDVSQILPGMNWPEKLREQLNLARVILVLIGPTWNSPRLNDPADWVRCEVETALNAPGKTVITLTIRGAKIPKAEELPDALRRLPDQQGVELRRDNFREDVESLAKNLAPLFGLTAKPLTPETLPDLLEQYYPLPKMPLPASPFKGFEFFTEKDAPVFFGRNREILELAVKIEHSTTQVWLFHGQSGAGKSSLLAAGLFPRLQHRYDIRYHRRDPSIGLAAGLEKLLAVSGASDLPLLVLLDQVEEIFTNPSAALPDERQDFARLLAQKTEEYPTAHFLLSFRKEFLAEIDGLLRNVGLSTGLFYLEPLQRAGILEAITGVTRSEQLQNWFRLETEAGLPEKIAADILVDSGSQRAPLLQFLLTQMWEHAASSQYGRRFDQPLYDAHKKNNLRELLETQMAEMQKEFPENIQSGLVLDILRFFVTENLTAAERSIAELHDRYPHVPNLDALLQTLKRLFLLTESAEKEKHTPRLAHDALAPVVFEKYNASDALDSGQRGF